MLLQARRLAKEQELGEADLIDLARQLLPSLGQRARSTTGQFGRPLKIMDPTVPQLQRAKQRVVLQPAGMVLAELCISGPQIRTRAGIEVGPGRIEQPELEQEDGVVVDRV